jgi:Arc/MetJ-type ribon-helix-helix transcriptional regulator
MYYIRNTMETVQARLPEALVEEIDALVKKGKYHNRSDVLRDAVRKLTAREKIHELVGIIPNTGDSVKEVRAIRKRLSKENPDPSIDWLNGA